MMRQLVEKMIQKDRKMYAVFVDLERAYDKDVGRSCGKFHGDTVYVSGDLLRVIRAKYQASEACVR